MEYVRYKQVKILEMKNIISKKEQTRLSTEEKNKLKGTVVDYIQTEAHRGKKLKKKIRYQVCVLGERSQRRGRIMTENFQI